MTSAWVQQSLRCASVNLLNQNASRSVSPIVSCMCCRHSMNSAPFSGAETTSAHTHLQVSEEPTVVLQNGIHAVCHRDRVLPVVIGNAPVVFLHRHNKATQLLKVKAVWKRSGYNNRSQKRMSTSSETCGSGTHVCTAHTGSREDSRHTGAQHHLPCVSLASEEGKPLSQLLL